MLQVVHQPALKVWAGLVAALLGWSYINFESSLSEMSMNAARSLASAIPARHSRGIWIDVVAPTLGMLAAAFPLPALDRSLSAAR